MVHEDAQGGQQNVIGVWNPVQQLREVDPTTVQYSKGFLRSRPERWFPGFAAQWLPLAHSLGVDVRAVEVRPVTTIAGAMDHEFFASVDGEAIAFALDAASADTIVSALIPNARSTVKDIALEYAVRRLLQSMALSWSSGESSTVRYESQMDPANFHGVAGVKFTGSVNGANFSVLIKIGKQLANKFDGLWRRQLITNEHSQQSEAILQVEVAHLTVPPTMLESYLASGTDIDLEVPVQNVVTILADTRPAFQAKLLRCGQSFAFEILPGAVPSQALPHGTNRLSVQLGSLRVPATVLTELSQPGAMYNCDIPISDSVMLVVAGEKVGNAKLRTYQGNLAITVV